MRAKLMWMLVAATVCSAAAQTAVTTSGTTSAGTVPVFGPSSNATVTNSPIVVSGSNVGIGTTNPSYTLDLNGKSRIEGNDFGGVTFERQSYPNQGALLFGSDRTGYTFILGNKRQSDGNVLPIISMYDFGNVGIGTTTPSSRLSVVGASLGSTAGNTTNLLSLQNTNGNTSYLNFYQLRSSGGTDWASSTTRIQQVIDDTGMGYIDFNPPNGNFAIAFGSGACCGSTVVANEYMRIASGGNVGIGTTNPQAKLEINGGLRFSGDTAGAVQTSAWTGVLCGGDYAEAVNVAGSKKSYEPGDVLALTEDGKQDVIKASEPYSTMVAGIYATKPGVIGRRQSLLKDSDDLPMAMVGIVPTKVSTENGSIHRGDLLVSSSTPGYAMKGTDRSRLVGAVVGKAMGSLDSGIGVIEVLVTLQ